MYPYCGESAPWRGIDSPSKRESRGAAPGAAPDSGGGPACGPYRTPGPNPARLCQKGTELHRAVQEKPTSRLVRGGWGHHLPPLSGGLVTDFSQRLASALRLVPSDAAAAFQAIGSLRQEALAMNVYASVSAATRALVFAAALTGDKAAELRFLREWHSYVADAAQRALDAFMKTKCSQRDDSVLLERLAVLVEKIVMTSFDYDLVLRELGQIRTEALAGGDDRIASRCLDEIILLETQRGNVAGALELARDLILESPSARAFNMLGRAAYDVDEWLEARQAFDRARLLASEEGSLDEQASAIEGISRLELRADSTQSGR